MMKKPSLLVIFLTVFIDLIGFGIVLPLLPIFAKNLNAHGLTIGALMASYSAMQFLFAPVWGRLSDRVGRRPILLFSTAGAAMSYALFAVGSGMTGGGGLAVLFVSRILAGVCGANITVAQAYIADITPPEDRSKRMGLIGMAFGLGFIFGPALGGVSLSGFSFFGWRFDGFGMSGPGWVAASFCAANFLFAFFRLPESRRPNSEHVARRPRFDQWLHTLGRPKIGLLVGIFFLATFCFASFETTLGLLVSEHFHLDLKREHDARIITWLFAYCGILGAVVQGGAIGRMVKRFGEPALIAGSLVLLSAGLAPLPLVSGWTGLLVALALLAIGSSLTRPPVFGLLSILTPANEQGETIGVAQSAGSLARIFGPLFAGGLYHYRPVLLYLTCAGISLLTGLLAWQSLCREKPAAVSAKVPTASQS